MSAPDDLGVRPTRDLGRTGVGRGAPSLREKLLNVASLWEVVITTQLGTLGFGRVVDEFVTRHVTRRVLTLVPIEPAHLVGYAALPLHHRDPFDRLVVGQASVLEVPIVTADRSFDAYDVALVW